MKTPEVRLKMVPLLALLSACAAQNALSTLPEADQNLLSHCRTPVMARACGTAQDDTSRAQCFERQSAIYAERDTRKSRRKWLLSNGCPEAIVDGGGTNAVAEVAPPASPAAEPVAVAPDTNTAKSAPSEQTTSVINAAFVPAPASPSPSVLAPVPSGDRAEGAPCTRSLQCASDICVESRCVAVAAVTAALATATAKAPAASPPPTQTAPSKPAPVAIGEPSGPRMRNGANAKKQLRAAIVAHEPEMKRCVDRQLKLVPTLRAAGTLVVDVDAHGQVPRIVLRGNDLTGSALEMCLRDLAVRWRFPRTGEAYSIEAPLVVSGAEGPS